MEQRPRQSGKTLLIKQAVATALARGERVINAATGNEIVDAENLSGEQKPPRRLSLEPMSPDFHPCYIRVGVRIDGEERKDIAYYNMDDLSYKTERDTSHLATSIEPYWRYQPSRQQRRAEERFKRRKL